MKNQILKPQVTTSKGGAGGIVRENPLMYISVNGGRYIVQGGAVMFEDGTVVEDPPGAFWTEYAKVSPELQESVNLNALTRKPFGGAVAGKVGVARAARQSADETAAEAERQAVEDRDAAAKQARIDAEARAAKAEAIRAAEDKAADDRRKATEASLAKLEADGEAEAKAAAEKEAAKKPFSLPPKKQS